MKYIFHALGAFILLKDFEDDFTMQEIARALIGGVGGLICFIVFYFTMIILADVAHIFG